jgi:hypothetical protein
VPVDDVHGHADRAALVGNRARQGLADPPRRVRRELVAAAPVELLDRADETDRPLLDEVEERQPLVAIALRDRDDEPEVRLDHRLLRAHVAGLDPLRELDLARRREQPDLADVLEEHLERVGRHLGRRLVERTLGGRRKGHLDVELVERAVELVHLGRLELELVESECELLTTDAARSLYGLEQHARLRAREDVRHRRVLDPTVPPGSDAALCQKGGPSRHGTFGLSRYLLCPSAASRACACFA